MNYNQTYIQDLVIADKEKINLDEIYLDATNRAQIEQLIKEHKYIETLQAYGLPVNNKILLHGHSGCGKTMTAKAIATALNKQIVILNLSNVVSSRIGETSQHLKMVFDKIGRDKAVLFLDEFDQIGKERGNDAKDVGEMRRLVNSLIQLIDYFPNNALLLCATNHLDIIDTALIRRFQLKLTYELPDQAALETYYTQLLSKYPASLQNIDRQYNISFAEAKDHALTAVKAMLIEQLEAGTLAPVS